MKFKFSKNLDYQLDAISAVVDIFDTGKNIAQTEKVFTLQSSPQIVGNEIEIDNNRILQNIQFVQERNNIEEKTESIASMDFSIEMETGTGKTYVYLRTVLELSQKYGLKKFIILVPSVAIREGVLKTIEQTTEHFKDIYGSGFSAFAYDSKKLSRVRDFAQAIDVQIMIMTIQSFNSDTNIMRQTPDRFHGESPLALVAATRPVVIMDEPQNMESELSKSAIADLNPLFKLRYSATHKEKHNLVYRLTPADAYRKGLVKKIEVFGVEEKNASAFIFRVLDIKVQKNKAPQARVSLEVITADNEYVSKEFVLQSQDDLYRKSGKNEKYQGLIINEIDAKNRQVELSDGNIYRIEELRTENKEEVFRTQIRETIKAHIEKQIEVGERLKVLSLFFIDRVDNYVHQDSLIRKIFEDEFQKMQKRFNYLETVNATDVHRGYFASKVIKGETIFKDTKGTSASDKEVYDLIMKNKERLLSFEESVSFIFSHSALKEGWDNPNVFQICTLNDTRSQVKKRQEIGRGLRLAVDIHGDRVFDDSVNVLTVIANESYQEFVNGLQREYTEAGYTSVPEIPNGRQQVKVVFNKSLPAESEDFKNLWKKIRQKTRFNIEVNSQRLLNKSVEKLNELDVKKLVVHVDKVQVEMTQNNRMKTIYSHDSVGEKLQTEIRIQNIIQRITDATGITRRTIFTILSKTNTLDLLFENPEEYTRSAILIIKNELNDLLINEGLQYFPVEDIWEVELFEDFKSYKRKTIESQKSFYNRVEFDSEGEREFAENLEKSRQVTLFTKLPKRFVIDTPLGTYNPDWAIVMKDDSGQEKLYLVRETKFVTGLDILRGAELQKILCGEKHFKAIGVDFKVSMDKSLKDLA